MALVVVDVASQGQNNLTTTTHASTTCAVAAPLRPRLAHAMGLEALQALVNRGQLAGHHARRFAALDVLLAPVVALEAPHLEGQPRFEAMELIRRLTRAEDDRGRSQQEGRNDVIAAVYAYAHGASQLLEKAVHVSGADVDAAQAARRTLVRVFHHFDVMVCQHDPTTYPYPFVNQNATRKRERDDAQEHPAE